MPTTDTFLASLQSDAGGTLTVLEFRATERLNRPTALRLRVSSDALEPARASEQLGALARMRLEGASGTSRTFGGVVRRIRFDGHFIGSSAVYSLDVVSPDGLLPGRHTTRIFQDLTVPEIVTEVFREAGVLVRSTLAREYAPRVYSVQYHESDLHFVLRLLADEGISYFVEDPSDDWSPRIVLADSVDVWARAPDPLSFRERSGFAATGEFAEVVRSRSALRPSAELVRAFDFRKPGVQLSAEARVRGARGDLFAYDYRLDLKTDVFDDRSAESALEARRRLHQLWEIESNAVTPSPGVRHLLHGHPSFDGWFATLSVEHRGWTVASGKPTPTRAGAADGFGPRAGWFYSNLVTCVPEGTAVTPKRPKRQLQQVMETATVVGPRAKTCTPMRSVASRSNSIGTSRAAATIVPPAGYGQCNRGRVPRSAFNSFLALEWKSWLRFQAETSIDRSCWAASTTA